MRVRGAGLQGADEANDVLGELFGLVDDLAGEELEGRERDGMGAPASFEGVEVARRGTAAAGPELAVAMGPAAGVAAHGPVVAAGYLTAGFAWVSGHDVFVKPFSISRTMVDEISSQHSHCGLACGLTTSAHAYTPVHVGAARPAQVLGSLG